MSERETYTVQVAGITRHLPLFEVAPGVRIAIFNMLGDTIVVKATAAALAEQLKNSPADVLVTAEAKGIPLIYEMSALMGLPTWCCANRTKATWATPSTPKPSPSPQAGRKRYTWMKKTPSLSKAKRSSW